MICCFHSANTVNGEWLNQFASCQQLCNVLERDLALDWGNCYARGRHFDIFCSHGVITTTRTYVRCKYVGIITRISHLRPFQRSAGRILLLRYLDLSFIYANIYLQRTAPRSSRRSPISPSARSARSSALVGGPSVTPRRPSGRPSPSKAKKIRR